MTVFLLSVAGMVVLALLIVLPVLLRGNATVTTSSAESNLSVLRDQFAELERDASNGLIAADHLAEAHDDLERRVLEDGRAPSAMVPRPLSSRLPAIVLALALPLLSGGLYWALGNPAALEAVDSAGHKVSPAQIEAMLKKLEQRLVDTPNDANGWAMLARSYLVLRRYQESADAYAKAAVLIPDDADLLADYADALAMAQGRRIDGKPMELVEHALRVDPTQWKALAMAGSAAFERKDYKKALGYWETLSKRPGLDPEFQRNIVSSIEEARQLAGGKAVPRVAEAAAPAGAAAVAGSPAIAAGSGAVSGTVRLSPAFAGKVAPTDTVFIFARAAPGPRMPLAVLRKQVQDLPFDFKLDDSMAMAPEMKLSKFPEVVVGARVSKTANAIPQSGDVQGASQPVRVGSRGIAVVIDATVP